MKIDREQKIVVIGGVAGGMSFAARARRLSAHAEIVVLERDKYVSYANCGLPYFVSGEIADRSSLLLQTPHSLRESLNLDVRIASEVMEIDRKGRRVKIRRLDNEESYWEGYDNLVLATGAVPHLPEIEGIDDPAVRTLRSVPDAEALRDIVAGQAKSAIVVGAGFIGVELAEALTAAGIRVDLVEMADQVLAGFDPEMARGVATELVANGVSLHLGCSLERIVRDGEQLQAHLSDKSVLRAHFINLNIGVIPESTLAKAIGLEINARGAVVVDSDFGTSDPHIFAIGDLAAVQNRDTGLLGSIPLAGPANRQGRAFADLLFKNTTKKLSFSGTAIVKVFGTTAAMTGLSEKSASRVGVPFQKVYLHPGNHAGYYPGAEKMHIKLLFAPDTGRILGAQIVGGEGVDKRIDVLATAIQFGSTVEELADLELAYAPQFGSAKDPVNMAGMIASNLREGLVEYFYPEDFFGFDEETFVVDVRSRQEFAEQHLDQAINIPHTELIGRLAEIPIDRPVRLYCASGFRSYLAYRALRERGVTDLATLSGGIFTLRNHHVATKLLIEPEPEISTKRAS